ncbi:MAG: hypothetical protein PHD21_01395 [Flavobacteriales bacterium]|nr:hypothetical protein [Flavobacteriales bacterium]
MKKNILVLALTIIATANITAQSTTDFKRNEISVGYGFAPVQDMFGTLETIVSFGLFTRENSTSIGAISAGYSYHVSKVVSLGATYAFSSGESDLYTAGSFSGHVKQQFHAVMAMGKFNWLNRKSFTMYSKVGIGVLLSSCDGDNKELDQNSTMVAFQWSPLGMEFGNDIAGFVEMGMGNCGFLQAGVRFRF